MIMRNLTNRIYTDGILGLKGLGKERRAEKETTLELTKQLDNYAKAQDIINKSMQKQRQIINPLITAQGKYKQKIDKDLLPTLDKLAKVYGFINKVNQETVDKDQELEDAKNAVAEAQRKEALSTAEEALQKKQLQQEIAELTFFQRQGKDVTEELAVAQEKLKDVEFELTRESEELRDAKKNLADIESEVESAVDESTSAIQEQIDAINELQEVTELFSTDDFQETLEALADSLGVSYGDIFNEIYTKYLELLQKVNNKPLPQIISEQLDEAGIGGLGVIDDDLAKELDDARKEAEEKDRIANIKPILTTGGFAGEFNSARASIDTGGNFSFLGEDIAAVTRAAIQQDIKVTVDLADNAEDFLQVTEERKARKGYAIR
jgi:DNA repair exonuclease SbcCD ATPase subunit